MRPPVEKQFTRQIEVFQLYLHTLKFKKAFKAKIWICTPKAKFLATPLVLEKCFYALGSFNFKQTFLVCLYQYVLHMQFQQKIFYYLDNAGRKWRWPIKYFGLPMMITFVDRIVKSEIVNAADVATRKSLFCVLIFFVRKVQTRIFLSHSIHTNL